MPRSPRVRDIPPIPTKPATDTWRTHLTHQFHHWFRHHTYQPGDWLPSSRALAAAAGTSRGVVVGVFDELAAAGLVELVPGSGARVLPGAAGAVPEQGQPNDVAVNEIALDTSTAITSQPGKFDDVRQDGPSLREAVADVAGADDGEPMTDGPGRPIARAQLHSGQTHRSSTAAPNGGGIPHDGAAPDVVIDARCGIADATLIDQAWWRAAWRAAAAQPPQLFAHSPHQELREALAQHVRATRHIPVTADRIIIVPSVTAGVELLARSMGWVGTKVAVEDPGYASARDALTHYGAVAEPVPVDADGVVTDSFPDDAVAAYVTPAHQFPLGSRLSAGRRTQLLDWAQARDALIIEDDFDGEFRYDVAPLPALAALPRGADHVAYLGTTSKVLAASVRVAWLIPPARLLPALRAQQVANYSAVSDVTGVALATMLRNGGVARHIAKVSRVYQHRRAALLQAAAEILPGWQVRGVEAGLHVVLEHPGIDDVALTRWLAAEGTWAGPLSAYCVNTNRRGLVIGYSRLTTHHATQLCRQVAAWTTR